MEEKQVSRRSPQMSADLYEFAEMNYPDQRLSAFISGKIFCFSPCLRVSVVK
jgi:hypothetical protein